MTLVIHEWRTPHPILEVKLLKNRNFAATVLFNFVLGAVLFGTTVLIPQFLQLMMGYSAREGRRSACHLPDSCSWCCSPSPDCSPPRSIRAR